MELLIPSAVPRDVAHIYWDRGHEEFDAVVRAESEDAVIVTELEDLWPTSGLRWIRRNEIIGLDVLDDEQLVVRVANLLGVRDYAVEDRLTDLDQLLLYAASEHVLVGVHTTTGGSGIVDVGEVLSVMDGNLHLRSITAQGTWDPQDEDFALDQIISVIWGNDYLNALRLILPA